MSATEEYWETFYRDRDQVWTGKANELLVREVAHLDPGTALDRSGHPNPVPRVVGPIRRRHPVQLRDLEALKANTERATKVTVPGPFTMSQQAQNDHYPDLESAALAYAAAVNAEVKDLFAAGADIVQLDEPYMQARPDAARAYGLAALNAALDGVTGTTAAHICFGYAALIHTRSSAYSFLPELAGCHCDQVSLETAQPNLDCSILKTLAGKTILLGSLDLGTPEVETPETVAARIRRALPFVRAENVVVAPDCGHEVLLRRPALALEALAGFYRSTEAIATARAEAVPGAARPAASAAPRSSAHLGADEPPGEVTPDTDWLKEATR